MKKFLFPAAIAAATFAFGACASEDTVEVQKGEAVTFRTVSGENSTRATSTDLNNLKDFRVYATYWNAAAAAGVGAPVTFMDALNVTRPVGGTAAGTNWTYAPAKYLPYLNGEYIGYLAYSPAGSLNVPAKLISATSTPNPECVAARSMNTTYTMNLAYKVPASELSAPNTLPTQQQEDFLVCAAKSNSEIVSLTFKHALSRLEFQAKTTNPNLTYTIKNIRLVNFANTAELAVTDNTLADPSYSWANHKVTNDDKMVYNFILPKDGVRLDYTGADVFKALTGTESYLYMMPQYSGTGFTQGAFSAATKNDAFPTNAPTEVTSNYQAALVVTYGAKDGYGVEVLPETTTRYIPWTAALDMGKAYTIQFTFASETRMTFNIAVTDWDNNSGSGHNVPLQ